MSAEERDSRDMSPDTIAARFAIGDHAGGAGALVGDLQGAGHEGGDRLAVVQGLQDLVECCKDGEYGFRTSAERAERTDLTSVLSRRAEQFRAFGDELNQLITTWGGIPEQGGSAMGAIHRGWVAIQATLGDNDEALLEGCERGQDNALARYRKALEQPLPDDIRSVVDRQLQMVQECHDEMKMLRDPSRAR